MDNTVRYSEFHTLRWLVWGLGAVSVLYLLNAIVQDAPANGVLVIGAFVGFFVAQFLAAVHRVNRITLTDSQLRVGKETFERTDFDFNFGVQPPLVLSPEEEDHVREEWKVPPEIDVRIAGGGWGQRRGTAMVLLRETGTEKAVAISTRHPRRLDALLTEWLETPPDVPP